MSRPLPLHRDHAFLTDRAGELIAVEADHRRHVVVEQTIAARKDGGLARSGCAGSMWTSTARRPC